MKEIYDLIIVGGGPAGLTAGIYASRARLKTLLLDKGVTGGQITLSERIENYPGFPQGISGLDLAQKMEEQAKRFGLEIKNLTEVTGLELEDDFKKILSAQGNFLSQAVIIATGTNPAKLEISGEDRLTGRGVSYCATCDGAFFKDKRVIVVGGGDSAISEALFLTKFASEVLVVHRRDELRATKILQEEAFANPKVKFIWNSHLIEIKGESKVEKGVIKNKLTNEIIEEPIDGVFIYVGNIPNTRWLGDTLELDEEGYILTNQDLETSVKGVFAAGDVRHSQLKQVAVAVGEGALASIMAERYLERKRRKTYRQ